MDPELLSTSRNSAVELPAIPGWMWDTIRKRRQVERIDRVFFYEDRFGVVQWTQSLDVCGIHEPFYIHVFKPSK